MVAVYVATAATGSIAGMTAPWNLVTLAPLPPTMASEALGELPITIVAPPADDAAAVAAVLGAADLLIYDWRASATGLTGRRTSPRAPHLAFVQQPSVGVPAHDIAALDAAGIPLANAAGFNAVAVAEWVLGALFAVARHLRWVEGEVHAGRWPQVDVIARGRSRSVVGAWGSSASVRSPTPSSPRCWRWAAAVSYWSRSRRAPADEHGATYRELDDLIATSDVLINLIALGEETRGLLSGSRLAALPAGALVVSASRGGIVDELAVLDAVESGHLAGAAFDVYEIEPLPAGQPAAPLRPDPADLAHGRHDGRVLRPDDRAARRQHPPRRHRRGRPQRGQRRAAGRAPALKVRQVCPSVCRSGVTAVRRTGAGSTPGCCPRQETIMKYMLIMRATDEAYAAFADVDLKEILETMGRFHDEMIAAGVLVAAEGLEDAAEGVVVDFSSQPPVVTDGPYGETKELFGGYYILDVASKEEAVEWAKRAPMAGPGMKTEIRRVPSIDEFPQDNEWVQKERAWREATGQL